MRHRVGREMDLGRRGRVGGPARHREGAAKNGRQDGDAAKTVGMETVSEGHRLLRMRRGESLAKPGGPATGSPAKHGGQRS